MEKHDDLSILASALNLLASAAHEEDNFFPFLPKSTNALRHVFLSSIKADETEKSLAVNVCEFLNGLTPESRVWNAHALESDLRSLCEEDVSTTLVVQCCTLLQQGDEKLCLRHKDGLIYSLDDARYRQRSSICVERVGRMRYTGEMRPSSSEPSGWEPDNQGKMEWNGGSLYEGQWHGNTMNGEGELRFGFISPSDSASIKGPCHENGVTYHGMFRGGVFDGKGNLSFPNGSSFTGNFDSGFCTSGNLTFPNKTCYSVKCRDGRIDGYVECLDRCLSQNWQPSSLVKNPFFDLFVLATMIFLFVMILQMDQSEGKRETYQAIQNPRTRAISATGTSNMTQWHQPTVVPFRTLKEAHKRR